MLDTDIARGSCYLKSLHFKRTQLKKTVVRKDVLSFFMAILFYG